jgi:hypothetical protein
VTIKIDFLDIQNFVEKFGTIISGNLVEDKEYIFEFESTQINFKYLLSSAFDNSEKVNGIIILKFKGKSLQLLVKKYNRKKKKNLKKNKSRPEAVW